MRKMIYFYKLIWIAWLIVKNQWNILKSQATHLGQIFRETIFENSALEKDLGGSSEIITSSWALITIHP